MIQHAHSKIKPAAAAIAAVIAFQVGAVQAHAHAGHIHGKDDYKGHWSESLVAAGLKNGLLDGYEDGSFRPDRKITRAELAVLLHRAYPGSKEAEIRFKDVAHDVWYAQAAANVAAAGYLPAGPDGTFRPDAAVTRAEAADALAALLHWDAAAAPAKRQYEDEAYLPEGKERSWLLQAVTLGFLQASSDGYILPNKKLTRSEAVLALVQAKGALPQGFQTPATPAVKEYSGTLEQAGKGNGIRVKRPDGSETVYVLNEGGSSLAGAESVSGSDGLGVKIKAVEGLVPDKLQVLGIALDQTDAALPAGRLKLKGILLESHHSKTANPAKHPKECLLMPDCAASGFGIDVLQQDGSYKFYKFDSKGHQLAAVLLDSIAKDNNIAIEADGSIDGDTFHVAELTQGSEGEASTAGSGKQEAGAHQEHEAGVHHGHQDAVGTEHEHHHGND